MDNPVVFTKYYYAITNKHSGWTRTMFVRCINVQKANELIKQKYSRYSHEPLDDLIFSLIYVIFEK